MLLNNFQQTKFITNSKPFFMFGEDPRITYDALLSLTLVLNTDVAPNVYLTTYIKTPNYLTIGFATDTEPVVSHKIELTEGLSVAELPPTDLLAAGCISVISTKTTEELKSGKVRISPLFVSTTYNTDEGSFIVNDNSINLADCNFIFENFNETSKNNTIIITKQTKQHLPVITPVYEQGIVTYNGAALESDVLTIDLPENYTITKLKDNMATVKRDAIKTICTNTDPGKSYFDPKLHYKSDLYPLDLLFTSYGEYKPERVDGLTFTTEELELTQLSELHGDLINENT